MICLDVMRAVGREPAALQALADELQEARGGNADLDRHVDALLRMLATQPDDPAIARRLAQDIALALSATVLVRHAPAFVADAFCASRLRAASFPGAAFGTLPRECDARAIVARAHRD